MANELCSHDLTLDELFQTHADGTEVDLVDIFYDYYEFFEDGNAVDSAKVESAYLQNDSPGGSDMMDLRIESPISYNSESDANTITTTKYRQEAIRKWHEKRKRRSFKKKCVCKARKEVAEGRPRKGGRFIKSTSAGFISITELMS